MSTPDLPKLKRQIYRLLWVELILSILILIPSLLPRLGSASIWVTPGGCLFALIHSITLLVLLRKGRNTSSSFPPTSKLATIICAWILVLVYIAGFGLALALLSLTLKYHFFWYADIMVIVELVLVGTQIGILVTIAVKCGQQRRSIMGTTRANIEYQPPSGQ
ncbi:hypothetical protein Hypma_001495 [Hypsizygus marmoreus]|uniref:MARVEL domain-containing protein n=1 Tax=Hypsizygus marmoreus TaxID=39966 RepID=A0A369K3S6_HYPMA|nr:hypothetical protein Hypma_001495 [Hypsizygus marmoreus]